MHYRWPQVGRRSQLPPPRKKDARDPTSRGGTVIGLLRRTSLWLGPGPKGNDAVVGSDRRALAEFDAAYPHLVTVAERSVRRFFRFAPDSVDDAVSETMTRTYERWERVRRHDNPAGWVVVCAKHVCLEH